MTTGPYITPGARKAAHRLARSLVILFAVTILLAGANLLYTDREVRAAQRSAAGACKFFADLAGLPVSVNPATGAPSLLAVQIVSDSRVAWRGLGCTGWLPAPSASFERWAKFYHLPA